MTISVTIISLDGKIAAKELNPMGEKPLMPPKTYITQRMLNKFKHDINEWQSAESKLRTFEIEQAPCCCNVDMEPSCQKPCIPIIGSVHFVEIISSSLVRIIN